MTRFINAADQIVPDALAGLLARSGGALARLDGLPQIKVVVRTDASADHVAVISGGGSGHEPAHAGFVGRGMLTAAVAGEPFASPSVDAVYAAILAVTGPAGCLLIVKNYTGDRLNFGLAAERARQRGLAVEMVIVQDDIALADAPQPRGIAGTLLAHKVAGYQAENGADLATVKARVDAVLAGTRSLGMALTTCDLLTQPARSQDSEPELGLGIHGEPGAATVAVDSARHAVAQVVAPLAAALPDTGPLALLINNLGGVTELEMEIITRDVLVTPLGQRCELLIGPAAVMTSLNMYGFSISALPLDDDALRTALAAPVSPAAWPQAVTPTAPAVWALPAMEDDDVTVGAEPDAQTEQCLAQICDALMAAEARLNELDAQVGDGDTGSTVAAGARAVRAALGELPLASHDALLPALGRLLARHMGGSSGVLLSLLLTAAGNALAAGATLVAALQQGTESMQHYGGARLGDRTFVDALLPALAVLADGGDLAAVADTAEQAAEQTGAMRSAGAGRSAYLRAESLAGHADPGAVAVAIALRALVAG